MTGGSLTDLLRKKKKKKDQDSRIKAFQKGWGGLCKATKLMKNELKNPVYCSNNDREEPQ